MEGGELKVELEPGEGELFPDNTRTVARVLKGQMRPEVSGGLVTELPEDLVGKSKEPTTSEPLVIPSRVPEGVMTNGGTRSSEFRVELNPESGTPDQK
jgi:hypothetical protein